MRKHIVLIMILCSLFLSGCSSKSICYVTCYADNTGKTVVYDSAGDFYFYSASQNTVTKCYEKQYLKQPALLYVPVNASYTISCNFVGNYSCTPTDAFAYATKLTKEGLKLIQVSSTPDLCVLQLDGEQHYVMYITKSTTRIYAVDENGKAMVPKYLGD